MPFVFELRCLLDWTFTPTALKFMYYLKLEDIHHMLLVARADIHDTYMRKRKLGIRRLCAEGATCAAVTRVSRGSPPLLGALFRRPPPPRALVGLFKGGRSAVY